MESSDDLFVEWFKDFWDSEIFMTPIGFIAFVVHEDHLFITHFFIGKEFRKDIERFHNFFHAFKQVAKTMKKKKIKTTICTTTKRWKALLWVEQRVAKFVVTDKTDDEYFLEYVL